MKHLLVFATIFSGAIAGGSLATQEWIQGVLAVSLMFAFNAILAYHKHVELLKKYINDNDQ